MYIAAAEVGDLAIIKFLLDSPDMYKYSNSMEAFTIAVERHHNDVVKFMIEKDIKHTIPITYAIIRTSEPDVNLTMLLLQQPQTTISRQNAEQLLTIPYYKNMSSIIDEYILPQAAGILSVN